jgi:SNF2 family DNA or RNA helicase
MLVIHAHWIAPRIPQDTGGVLFWGEDSESRHPTLHHGRPAQKQPVKSRAKAHPFQANFETLRRVLNKPAASRDSVLLSLPSTRSGPLPSPQLAYNWRIDRGSPALSPWLVTGVRLLPQDALPLLLNLPVLAHKNRSLALGEDAKYWRIAATLVVEAMAAQKVVPEIKTEAGGYYARWVPVFDSPRDAQRVSFMEKTMPPICRAGVIETRPARRRGGQGKPARAAQPSSRQSRQAPQQAPGKPPRQAPQNPGRRPRRGSKGPGNTASGRSPGGMPPIPVTGAPAAPAPTVESFATPHALLSSFLNTLCDALARQWGWTEMRKNTTWNDLPAFSWLAALFRVDASIKGTPAQLQTLESGFRAWIRNLHLAGDAAFRIAFRLEPPGAKANGENGSGPQADGAVWRLHYLIQARDDPSLIIPADTVWKSAGGALNTLGRRFDQPQEKLLAGLGYAGRIFDPIAASLKEKSPTHFDLDTREAYAFLREAAPELEEAGFGLLVPPWWNKPGARLGMRLRLKPTQKMDKNAVLQGNLSLDRLIGYRWELSIGDTSLTEEEFRALAALKAPLVQVRGQWVTLDPEQVEAAIHFWENQQLEGEIGLLEALQMSANPGELSSELPVDEIVTEDWLTGWLERFRQPGKVSELPQPEGLHGQLRPYQRFGYSWLSFFNQWNLGAILADDMGLGKTVQTLALLLKEKEQDGRATTPALLIAPTSVVTNWEREVRRFTPGLCTLIHQGPSRLRGDAFIEALRGIDLVLSSYALARQDADLLQSVQWDAVIVDEAQNIKNPSARQTQMIRKFPARFRLALTGTPVENRLSDLWSIMQFLNPGYLGSQEAFRTRYALPIERYNDPAAREALKKVVNPFILRRVKTDPTVIQDLPEKVETKVYTNLTEEQASLYEAVVQAEMQKVEESEGIGRRGNVLSMLMQLKQVCNHPVQFLHQGESASPEDIAAWGQRSGKLERLTDMLEEILAEGDRTLIFSQFAEMGEMLAAYLPQALGVPVQFLHGSTPARARDEMIRTFQEEPNGPPIFILSLKAGGVGLNLTRATHVFHFDRWWNPAVENQATDRAFRIGQKQNVQVHKFITLGTLEEMIDEMIENKKGLAESIIGSGENWLTELSTDDLRDLVQLRKVS